MLLSICGNIYLCDCLKYKIFANVALFIIPLFFSLEVHETLDIHRYHTCFKHAIWIHVTEWNVRGMNDVNSGHLWKGYHGCMCMTKGELEHVLGVNGWV